MKTGRRTFLQYASLAPTSLVAGVATASPAPAHISGAALTRSAFAPLVGHEFAFEKSALENTGARLVSVEALASKLPGQDEEGAFRLVFQTGPEDSLETRTFSVSHPKLGRFALFVSPNDAEGRRVEAIFNRL
jgi:hypothetical protein